MTGTSWNVIIGSIASSLAILIFITGRTSLVDLFRKKSPVTGTPHQPAAQPGKLTRFLNKPVFLIIGIISSILGIYAFTKDLIGNPDQAFKEKTEEFEPQQNTVPDTSQEITPVTDTPAIETAGRPNNNNEQVFTHRSTTTLRTGILIFTADSLYDAKATFSLLDVMGYIPTLAVRGTLSMEARVVGHTEYTKVLSHTITIRLQFYHPDGLHPCNACTFSEEVIADDQKPINVIKEQALTAIRKQLLEHLSELRSPCI